MPISSDRLYVFATVREPFDAWYERASRPQEMRARFSEFGGPARQFLDDLDDHSEVLYTAVEEVAQPLPWHAGRVVLIGDAAHASTLLAQPRQPACKFVQDASRQVGEAGANEAPQSCVLRNAAMNKTAQQHVGVFYRSLYALQAGAA